MPFTEIKMILTLRHRGRKIYEPPRYMTINQAAEQLLEIEENRGEGVCTEDTLAIGCARIGTATQKIVAGSLKQLLHVDFGGPLHSLVLVGSRMHDMEADFIREFAADPSSFDDILKKHAA